MADEYLQRPDLTRKAFVRCRELLTPSGEPLALPDGEDRLYRTGDLARWVGNELEFLGRVDDQVKLRGLRIELGEIESQLRAMTGIVEAQVIVREEDDGSQHLIAFVSPTSVGKGAGNEEVCAQLRAGLPHYMIPERFKGIEPDSWPRTTTGKIDRKALAKMDLLDSQVAASGAKGEASGADGDIDGPKDSLGLARKMRQWDKEVDSALDNIRAFQVSLIFLCHWTMLHAPEALQLKISAKWQWAYSYVLMGLHTQGLAMLTGYDDSRNDDPYLFTAREPLFLFLIIAGTRPGKNMVSWYFPAFLLARAYTVIMHRLRVPSLVSVGLFGIAWIAGFWGWWCGSYGHNRYLMFLKVPYMVFDVFWWYWLGFYCGPWAVAKGRHTVAALMGDSSASPARAICVRFTIVGLMLACASEAGLHTGDAMGCGETMDGLAAALNLGKYLGRLVNAFEWHGLAFIFHLSCCVAVAVGMPVHLQVVGRSVLGALFFEVYIYGSPFWYAVTGWQEVLFQLVDARLPPIVHFFVFIIVAFSLPALFMHAVGPFFMWGLSRLAQFVQCACVHATSGSMAAGLIWFVIIGEVLNYTLSQWFDDSIYPQFIAGTLASSLIIGVALGCGIGLLTLIRRQKSRAALGKAIAQRDAENGLLNSIAR